MPQHEHYRNAFTFSFVFFRIEDVLFTSFFNQHNYNNMEIISTILIGAVAGWLGSTLFKGSSLGLLGNIIVGIIGSFVGSWSLGELGVNLGTGWVGAILTGAIGALIILFLLNLIFKKRL